MRLPDSLFNRIVSALHTEEPAGPGTGSTTGSPAPPEAIAAAHDTPEADGRGGNRRAFRRRVNHPVRYVRQGAPAAVPEPATLLDVSAVGVCILCDRVAGPGEHLLIHLPCTPESGIARAAGAAAPQPVQTMVLPCAVRSCRVRANGMFRVGAEFADPAGDGGGAGAGAADALRRGERLPPAGRATMYLYHRDGRHAPLERVAVRDYSEHGVAILRGEPLEVGTELVIRLPREEDKPITRLCRVVNVAPSDGRYRIGGEFIRFTGRSWLRRLWDWIA
jgi:hypothetical protein